MATVNWDAIKKDAENVVAIVEKVLASVNDFEAILPVEVKTVVAELEKVLPFVQEVLAAV